MYLQGDLQKVFDALFHLGVIDPVLKLDWVKEQKQMHKHHGKLQEIVTFASAFKGDAKALTEELKKYDDKILGYLAMEVAREFSNFHGRKKLH